MTRDEAIKSIWMPSPATEWAVSKNDAGKIVDRLEALGVLKLDKNPMTIFCEEMGWPEGGSSYQILFRSLDKAGLKIVEASSLSRPPIGDAT